MRNAYKILFGKLKGINTLEKLGTNSRIILHLKGIGCMPEICP
jgi:hypothetical protein